MVNILSVTNKPLLGKEIKEWILFHQDNETEYTKMAKRMARFENISDDKLYKIVLRPSGTGCGEIKRYHPIIVNVFDNWKENIND